MKRELYTDEFLAWVDGNKKGVGEQLIKFRKKCGLSQKKLAEKSGVSVKTIMRIEKARSNYRLSTLFFIVNDGLEMGLKPFHNHPLLATKPPKGPILKNPPQPEKKVIKKRKTK